MSRSRDQLKPGNDSRPVEDGSAVGGTSLSGLNGPSTEGRTFSALQESDNSPRRHYTHGTPAAYRDFRNHTLGHLRKYLRLEEMLTIRLGELSWTPHEVSLGEKRFTNDRMIAEVFEAFLEKRRELAAVIPALGRQEALLFPAMDGGPLLVSHRPQGISHEGLHEFVTSRDQLLSFLFHKIPEQDLRYFTAFNLHELRLMRTRFKGVSKFEPLVCEYLAAREKWLVHVDTLAQALRTDQGTTGVGRLILALEIKAALSADEQVQLGELRDLKASVEQEIQRKYEVRVRANRQRAIPRADSSPDEITTPDDEQEDMEGPLAPVYLPNTKLVFLGTDGGALFGDTGQNSTKR